ncbi:conserved protein of unknown function [Methanocaldococcus lauensis]|uniref:Dehydrogenase (Flavoprotein)-like protein n=1 Tax=Methanocaldococcus lauensis TaxID=2546128 RepID=A0A8D6PUS6_9EURY|nr:NAD(P)/FAD-dependent oxidoreductase [Methanocaldococcus lauensis]CAB3289086.1 conserved protein of unknown function [Methanocaldococcus lauensis]
MRVGIIGAGVSGSVLYRLLYEKGFYINIYDPLLVRGCKSSTFVFSKKSEYLLVKKILKKLNIHFQDYIVKEINEIDINGVSYFLNKKIYIVNKPKLIEDLVPRTLINQREFKPAINRFITKVSTTGTIVREFSTEDEAKYYDLVVDASGNAKVLQLNNKSTNDIKVCQFLINSSKKIDNILIDNIKISHRKPLIGYSWVIPIENEMYHIGCAYYKNSNKLLDYLTIYVKKIFGNDYTKICSCISKINGNLLFESFISGHYQKKCIASIGESIGLVSPFGHGNVYAIISAYILSKFINKYEPREGVVKYKNYMLKNFDWLDKDKKSLKNLNLLKITKLLKEYYNIPTHESMKILFKSIY